MSTGRDRDVAYLEPSPDDWLLSDKELKELEDHIQTEVEFDTEHDIPYTAGYSMDGKTIFIDRTVPQYLEIRARGSRTKKVKVDIWKTFALHEAVEKSLEDQPYFWPYQFSHQVALRAERAYVEALGADWNDYNEKTLAIVDKVYKRGSFDSVPWNLDLGPYVDEKDRDCLRKMGKEEALE